MKRLKWMLAAFAVIALSTATQAFQETKGGVAQEQQEAAPSAQIVGPAKGLDLSNTGVSVAEPGGVEVRIPGLGKLGVLPKFDFGLELLYGLNESKTLDSQQPFSNSEEDDVQIRGSIKHRF
ncbi:MAG: hypothetical protein ACK5JT_17700 [Hyphomicrobiaceae bacterium]